MHVDAEKKQMRGARTSGISLIVVDETKGKSGAFPFFHGFIIYLFLIMEWRMNYD